VLKIIDVDPSSPLFGYIRPGYEILSVNGTEVQDAIDFYYKATNERVNLIFSDNLGKKINFDFDELMPGELGLTFDEDKIKTCDNDCIFCFIRQQPKGMRRALYIKDEDYRLSFTHGNFITLSNTTDEDIERIIKQRLSPLYVSVHATDDKLRRYMLHNEKLAPILPRIKELTDNGITIHTQVVLCPGINDGKYIEQTINDLASLYSGVETLAVVPVGLTKYRDNLPNLRTYQPDEAKDIINYIDRIQKRFLKEIGTRFVWAADEFYVAAHIGFPNQVSYEEMSQFENGVGMAREFLTNFNRRKRFLKSINSNKKALFLTGYSAYPFLTENIIQYLKLKLKLNVEFEPVKNDFWGETVTVSGLLTGNDLLRCAISYEKEFDVLVIPPNCLNDEYLFLDNLSLTQFETELGKPVVLGQYDLADTLKEVFK